jgi:DNA-binding Lrp family transcriptional regulator
MDTLDERLVLHLRNNARRSISDLAIALGVSRATVRARIQRLEKAGEIVGYTIVLRSDLAETRIRGIMMIEVQGHAADRVIKALSGLPEVAAVHTTNGSWDLVAELSAATLPEFDAVLRKIRLIAGITRSETNLLLATPRSARASPR